MTSIVKLEEKQSVEYIRQRK